MAVINIIGKHDLEGVLRNACINQNDIKKILDENKYFDEYHLTSDKSFVKVFRQVFIKDSYISSAALQSPSLVRLITYPDNVNFRDLFDIFDCNNLPIITRSKRSNLSLLMNNGFEHLENKDGNPTILLPIVYNIPEGLFQKIDENISKMSEEDIFEIEELFRIQYSLRYRMARMMFNDCPEACFTYKHRGGILGVTFNQVQGDKLYMRQIFVKEGFRGKSIGRKLHNNILNFAKEKGVGIIYSNIRRESEFLHRKYNPVLRGEFEYYVVRR